MEFLPPGLDKGVHFLPKGFQKSLGHVGIGLKVALADIWPHGTAQVLRLASIEGFHFLHHPGGNAQGSAPPSGVSPAYGTRHRIVEEDGGAVRGEDHQGGARSIRHQSIAVRQVPPVKANAPILFGDLVNDIRMDLSGQSHLVGIKAQGRPQNGIVLPHLFRVVSPAHA